MQCMKMKVKTAQVTISAVFLLWITPCNGQFRAFEFNLKPPITGLSNDSADQYSFQMESDSAAGCAVR